MTPQLWLQSERDYETGRRLYDALGSNAHLKRTLSFGPSAYNTKCLAYELDKLAKAGVSTEVVPVATYPLPEEPRPLALIPKVEPVARLPEPSQKQQLLDLLAGSVQAWYDKRRYLHAQLELVGEHTRLQFAQDIQRLSRTIDEHWKTVAYVKEHGHMRPVEPAMIVFDVKNGTMAELLQLRTNLRSNISKLKKKPARADDLARAQAEEQQLTARINELKGKEVARG